MASRHDITGIMVYSYFQVSELFQIGQTHPKLQYGYKNLGIY